MLIQIAAFNLTTDGVKEGQPCKIATDFFLNNRFFCLIKTENEAPKLKYRGNLLPTVPLPESSEAL